MKNLRWRMLHLCFQLCFKLAKWSANRYIARTNAMLRIMRDVNNRMEHIMEAEE